MKKIDYLFRVDASYEIGSGHVMRCLTLALKLAEKGFECVFVYRLLPGNLSEYIKSKGFKTLELESRNNTLKNSKLNHKHWLGVSWQQDVSEINNLIKSHSLKLNWIIVDHYAISLEWEKEMSSYCNNLMVIDDLADRSHHCSILLDQNLNNDDNRYLNLVPKNCKLLLGPKYSLLRPEFKNFREKSLLRRSNGNLNNILINFGGGDRYNLISKTLKALSKIKISSDIKLNVVYGSMTKKDSKLESVISSLNNEVEVFSFIDNMGKFLSKSDLVIGAGGSSSWERCCLGVPGIILSVAYNQDQIIKNLDEAGAIISIVEDDLMNGKLKKILDKLKTKNSLLYYSKNASSITDGNGADKIVNELVN